MKSKRLNLAPLLLPALPASGASYLPESQRYDLSYQLYQEDDDRIRVEAWYLRGNADFGEIGSFRFQYLHDAISGASPTGALPGGVQPYYAEIEDVREGVLGAMAHQFGDHRVELELSYSEESDYISRGLALSDSIELNEKNTTLSFGVNLLDDTVKVPRLEDKAKNSYDFFTGVSQIIDKNTVVSANLTLGYGEGYLNDPYKVVQRTDIEQIPDGLGGTIDVPVVNLYSENRPDSRFRQVLQLEGRHYVEPAKGAVDAVLRLSNDDYGIFSQAIELEWRQEVGEKLQLVPFFRFYHQNEADFYVQSLDGLNVGTPSSDPDGSGVNYSADYRLSSLNAISGGLRLNYQINDHFGLSAAYERYAMDGTGSASARSQDEAYPTADIWTFGLNATF